MHDQPTGGPVPPAAGTRAHEVQRKVLLELVLAPPPYSDDVADVTARIGEQPRAVEEALAALAAAGLVAREGELARATTAARYCEALFRLCP